MDDVLRSDDDFQARITAMRRFNRFYIRHAELLQKGSSGTTFSLAEIRVLVEISLRDRPTATEIGRDIDLDAGYMSRMLRMFEVHRLVTRKPSEKDARQTHLALTARGRKTVASLDQRFRQKIARILGKLPQESQTRVVTAMRTIERLMAPQPGNKAPYLLRPHRPGDMGWVVSRHAAIYADDFGWDITYEAFVAELIAKFILHFDAKREHCWIAEVDGNPVGSVFLMRATEQTATLCLLIVDPTARGIGIGQRLVEECIRFARQAGYRNIKLTMPGILVAARHIFQTTGFSYAGVAAHPEFGIPLTGEAWEFRL